MKSVAIGVSILTGRLLCMACVALWCATHSAMAQDPSAYLLSRTLDEGLPNAFVIVGNTAYVAAGTKLIVLDITNPTNPVRLGSVATKDEIKSVAIEGDLAFLANTESGLQIVDIGRPEQANIIGSYQTEGRAYGVDASGNLVFVGDTDRGMDIIDVSNPSFPQLVSQTHFFNGPTPGQGVNQVAVRDTLAYIVDFFGITIYDVSDPFHPDSLSHYARAAYKIDFKDSLVFLAANTARRIESFVLDSTFHLRRLGTLGLHGRALDVRIARDFAYVACEENGIDCVDISDPDTLRLISNVSPDSLDLTTFNVAVLGDLVFACTHSYGVLALNYAEPTAPTIDATIGFANYPIRMDKWGRMLYVANYYRGITLVDVANFGFPVELASTPHYGHWYTTEGVSVFERGDSVYAVSCDVNGGFRILNTTNPTAPYLRSTTTLLGAKGAKVDGNFAYIARSIGSRGLWIYDLTDLSAPTFRGRIPLTDYCEDVVIHGDRAYVTDRWSGLKVIDISNPDVPTLAGSYPFGRVLDVELNYPYAYVVGPELDLHVLDISTDSPQLIEQVEIAGNAQGLDIDSSVAIVAGDSGISILSLDNPANPEVMGVFPIEGEPTQVEIILHKAVVSALFGGISIVDISEFYTLPRTSLIVAGGGSGSNNFEYFVRNTNPSTNDAFMKLADSRNYERPRVYYLNPSAWQDINGDGNNDHVVDENNMTPAALRDAIASLVDSDSSEFPNIIFLSGHGQTNEFDINGDPGQNVSTDSLAAWIDRAELESRSKLIIIIEACYSGSMLERLSTGHPNRIVITSGGENEVCSYLNGRSFSTELWAGIWEGRTLWSAFDRARAWLLENNILDQNPKLEANGDGIPLQLADRVVADSIVIGGDIQGGATLPVILDAPPHANMVNDSLTVTITCNGAMENVWFRIFPQHYNGIPDPASLPNGSLHPLMDSRYLLHYENDGSLNQFTNYLIEINALDDGTNLAIPRVITLSILDDAETKPVLPTEFRLYQNYPNPFNSETRIRYSLAATGQMTMKVYDILGREVSTLLDETRVAGTHEIIWNGRTNGDAPVASGLYFVTLHSGTQRAVIKTLLLK